MGIKTGNQFNALESETKEQEKDQNNKTTEGNDEENKSIQNTIPVARGSNNKGKEKTFENSTKEVELVEKAKSPRKILDQYRNGSNNNEDINREKGESINKSVEGQCSKNHSYGDVQILRREDMV